MSDYYIKITLKDWPYKGRGPEKSYLYEVKIPGYIVVSCDILSEDVAVQWLTRLTSDPKVCVHQALFRSSLLCSCTRLFVYSYWSSPPRELYGILNLKKKYIVGRLQAVSPFRRNPLRKSKQRNCQKQLTWCVKHLHRKCYTHARHITVLSHVVLMRLTCVSDCCQQTNRHWCGQVRLFFTRLSLLRNQEQFWS